MKKILQTLFGLLLLLTLSGCPIMMPFMMGPMLAKDGKSGDPKVEAVVQDLTKEGVTALTESRGTYNAMLLDGIKVKGKFIQEERFRGYLLEALRSRGEWVIIDGEKPSHQGTEHGDNNPAFLNADLYERQDLFHLNLEMGDSRTKQLVWTRTFLRPVPESPGSHSHN